MVWPRVAVNPGKGEIFLSIELESVDFFGAKSNRMDNVIKRG